MYSPSFLCKGGILSFPLDCGLGAIAVCIMQVVVSPVEKGPSGISPRSQEHGGRDDLGVLEWENKNKQTKSQISAFLAFKVSAFSGERELKEGLGIFTTPYNHGV